MGAAKPSSADARLGRADGLLRVGVLRRSAVPPGAPRQRRDLGRRTCRRRSRAVDDGRQPDRGFRVALLWQANDVAPRRCGDLDVRRRRRRARGLVLGGARRAPRRHGVVGCHQSRSVGVPPSGRAVGATRHGRLLRLDGLECRRHRRSGRAWRARRGAQRRLGVRRRWPGDGRSPAAPRPAAAARRRPGRDRR